MMNLKEIEDRMLIKELVDTVSVLGDKKDFNAQVQLFSEEAVSETFANRVPLLKLKGRKEMVEAFGSFLKDFETVYHFNGQHTVSIAGDYATGTCYCMITLISNQNGGQMKMAIGAVYQDDYVRENNHWLIAKRTGTFKWQEKTEIHQ